MLIPTENKFKKIKFIVQSRYLLGVPPATSQGRDCDLPSWPLPLRPWHHGICRLHYFPYSWTPVMNI
jgi:hypothetical protein